MGIAGSGKGTQAALLAKRTGWPALSSGEVLRRNMSDPGIKARLDAGQLVSDEELFPLLEAEFNKIGASQNEFILDGTPRNVNQSRWLVQKIKTGQLKLTAIIHIKLSRQSALKRLQLRSRHDDKRSAIAGRFKFYEQSVIPAIRYFEKKGCKVDEVDGEGSPEEVETSIRKVLEKKMKIEPTLGSVDAG